MPPPPITSADSSILCQACGLCCDGSLHQHVNLRGADVQAALRLGLTVEDAGATSLFRQPCPLFQRNCCSAYLDRPRVCANYKCGVLRAYQSEEMTLEDGMAQVARARMLLEQVMTLMPPHSTLAQVREDIGRWQSGLGMFGNETARTENQRLFLIAGLLFMHMQQHFLRAREPMIPPGDGS